MKGGLFYIKEREFINKIEFRLQNSRAEHGRHSRHNTLRVSANP